MRHSADAESVLRIAIERLYSIFARYPLRAHIEGCPCCTTSSDLAAARTRPLRSLTPADLSTFAADALLTWGDRDDFKHFLPRLCELSSGGEHDGLERAALDAGGVDNGARQRHGGAAGHNVDALRSGDERPHEECCGPVGLASPRRRR